MISDREPKAPITPASNLFDSSSYFFEEPGNLLKQELREPAVYNSIIRAVAEGAFRMNGIAVKTGIASAPCAKFELCDVGQWWGTDPRKKRLVQIDIMATPVQGNEYIIGSCKFKNEKIGMDGLELLRGYAMAFGLGKGQGIIILFFLKVDLRRHCWVLKNRVKWHWYR